MRGESVRREAGRAVEGELGGWVDGDRRHSHSLICCDLHSAFMHCILVI